MGGALLALRATRHLSRGPKAMRSTPNLKSNIPWPSPPKVILDAKGQVHFPPAYFHTLCSYPCILHGYMLVSYIISIFFKDFKQKIVSVQALTIRSTSSYIKHYQRHFLKVHTVEMKTLTLPVFEAFTQEQ